jgi:hypothetical protein
LRVEIDAACCGGRKLRFVGRGAGGASADEQDRKDEAAPMRQRGGMSETVSALRTARSATQSVEDDILTRSVGTRINGGRYEKSIYLQARISFTTVPCTSVSRKSRPW